MTTGRGNKRKGENGTDSRPSTIVHRYGDGHADPTKWGEYMNNDDGFKRDMVASLRAQLLEKRNDADKARDAMNKARDAMNKATADGDALAASIAFIEAAWHPGGAPQTDAQAA